MARHGSGHFRTAALRAAPATRHGRLLRYAVRVERGLPFDPETTARTVHRILSDSRSWVGSGDWRLKLVDSTARADFDVLVATPDTTDRLCLPLRTGGELSCQAADSVVLNGRRWARGSKAYGSDLKGYRTYLVNHEVGHRLGRGHVGCPGRGRRAPVMMQQTKGLDGCRPNPWPAAGRH